MAPSHPDAIDHRRWVVPVKLIKLARRSTFSAESLQFNPGFAQSPTQEYTATQDIQKMAAKMQTNINAAFAKQGTTCKPWTPGNPTYTPSPPPS